MLESEKNRERLVIVTGGTRGIGLAIARQLAEQGYALALWFHQRKPAESLLAELLSCGATALYCTQVDVSDRASVVKALAALEALPHAVYGLVNNAGILQQKPFESLTDQEWDRLLDINLKGSFICAQLVLPLMREKGAGSIVNISSSGGQLGGTLAVHYAVSKAGVIALSKSLARLGADDQIRVNCVAPGLIETEMTQAEISSPAGIDKVNQLIPLHRVGQPDEIADAVSFLLSDRSRYITGQTLNVNGGLYMG
ncbi:MAG: SDR family oxidoreductase [Gammaproteobacteria bacterium]|nr:SDR family oxidoreductase [Gammaproteobacteria bacterium]MCF6230154.1 SDR family oxidoreductase [Gammaproteobacteria bacterium]